VDVFAASLIVGWVLLFALAGAVAGVLRRRRLPLDVPELPAPARSDATLPLRALLKARGRWVRESRLNRACAVNEKGGASIDDLERVAIRFGLPATQVILPPEHLVTAEAGCLPAIAILKPFEHGGPLRFVLLWRVEGGRVEVLNVNGRRTWVDAVALLRRLHKHELSFPADRFESSVRDRGFQNGLRGRMRRLGLALSEQEQLLTTAISGEGWRPLAALEGALRQATHVAPPDPLAFVRWASGCAFRGLSPEPIPAASYFAKPAPPTDDGVAQVALRGAVAITFNFPPSMLPGAKRSG
jgi:hypothetical protein